MATASLSSAVSSVAPKTSAPVASAPLAPTQAVSVATSPATEEHTAAAWQAIGRLADKLSNRDALADGAAYTVNVQIKASIGKQTVVDTIGQINLTVGHATTKASSTGPDQAHLLAVLFSKLNRQTREAICRELAADYAANGCELPEVDKSLTEAATDLLKRLRQEKRVSQRGPVKAAFLMAPIDQIGQTMADVTNQTEKN
jgi:hypothetical protein